MEIQILETDYSDLAVAQNVIEMDTCVALFVTSLCTDWCCGYLFVCVQLSAVIGHTGNDQYT